MNCSVSSPKSSGCRARTRTSRIPELLKLVNSNTLRSVRSILFKGMQQRVGLRSAHQTIPIGSSHEPTSGLDPLGRMKFVNHPAVEERGQTVSFVA